MAQRRREEHRTAAMARGTGREKDRDRDKEREREKDRDREKERVREKEKEERDKDKGKERDREKEKERISVKDKEEREKEKGKERDRDKEKERDREKGDTGKDKDRDRAKEREKERELDKERQRERDKERQRERERERELERDRQKLKQKERDNDRDRGRERERDNERERDRERDRDNERDRGRERDIERDRQKYKQRDKDRDQDAEKKEDREKPRDDREKGHKGLQGSANAEKEKDRQRQKQDSEKWGEKDRHRDDREKSSKEAQLATTEFEDKIARIREERLKSNVDKRSSRKAEPEKPLDEDNISAWVVKTRKLEIEKAARMAKILSEQDNEEEDEGEEGTKNAANIPDTSSLAGLRVRHGFDKVMEGGAVVLTLKDTNILAGDDVNEEGDELENIEMAEQKQREDAYKAAKKKPGTYEDKFINDIAGVRSILPQYDDAVKEEGLVLDESGGVSEESKQRLEEIRQKLQGIGSRMEQSLNSKAVAADFYTEEEMLQFKKPKTKRKLRKKDKLDIYALEAEAAASGIGAQDHGSRASGDIRAVKRAEEEEIADKRKNAYQNALSKAVDASKVLQGTNTIDQMQVDEEVPAFGADEDDELHRSLERSRQASLKKQSESAMAGPQGLAAQLAALRQSSGEASQVGEGDDKKDLEDKKLVFTDTGEFCRSLQLDEAITRRAGTKDAFGEEDEEPPSSAMEEDVPAGGGWTEVKEAAKVPGSGEDAGEEKEELEAPIKETSVGKGLAGALQLLQERGTLRETIDWGGRNMDKKRSKLVGVVEDPKPQAAPQPAREIILDRVDEFGRTMTPKEAFRKLSHKFHGKGPGKMKQEKRMKQHQEELKLKQMNSGDTPLMSMEKIREAQANLHSPYIVISGHIKPGQTSDPRSGFATVEKEPIGSLTPMLGDKNKVGSLTPMLGDKKVEHFLGIKRKHDNGSMGPPPPKKPKADQ